MILKREREREFCISNPIMDKDKSDSSSSKQTKGISDHPLFVNILPQQVLGNCGNSNSGMGT